MNTALVQLYWQIGARIRKDILANRPAEYGKEIFVTLAQELEADFGSGYSASNLSRMVAFAEAFPDNKIVVSLMRQLSSSHFVTILPLTKTLQRDFYAEMCRVENWSVRTLREKFDGMHYERNALSLRNRIISCAKN